MQYPPQQPTDQPAYAPAEMVVQEQSQAYPQQTPVYAPQNQQFVPGQEIAIYANRTQAILRTTILAICLLVLILLIPFVLILGFMTAGPPAPSDIPPLIFAFVIVLAGIAFISWLTWRTASDLLSRKPILLINREGITVSRMPMLSGFFIPWAEIEALAPSRYILYKYLCIIPRNQDQFLLRFKPLERFSRRLNSAIGSPLAVPQLYLGRPVEEILNALYYGYANELNYYHVQLRP
jgi:hypothetical protein